MSAHHAARVARRRAAAAATPAAAAAPPTAVVSPAEPSARSHVGWRRRFRRGIPSSRWRRSETPPPPPLPPPPPPPPAAVAPRGQRLAPLAGSPLATVATSVDIPVGGSSAPCGVFPLLGGSVSPPQPPTPAPASDDTAAAAHQRVADWISATATAASAAPATTAAVVNTAAPAKAVAAATASTFTAGEFAPVAEGGAGAVACSVATGGSSCCFPVAATAAVVAAVGVVPVTGAAAVSNAAPGQDRFALVCAGDSDAFAERAGGGGHLAGGNVVESAAAGAAAVADPLFGVPIQAFRHSI